MKKKELEIFLQRVPSFEKPISQLEQYITPANIAADIINIAHQYGDIKNKIIVDLGCGTGIFSMGSKLTGARKVIGIDIDFNCIDIAKKHAIKNNLEITFLAKDIDEFHKKCDTVIMNPPFGAQKSNIKADRKFIEKGFEIAEVLYSIHLGKTIPFVNKLVSSLGGNILFSKDYIFPIKWMFEFHDKECINYNVTLLRIITS